MPNQKVRMQAHPRVLQEGAQVRVVLASDSFAVGETGTVLYKFRHCRFCGLEQRFQTQRCDEPGKSTCQWNPYWILLEVTDGPTKKRRAIQARNCEPVKEA